MRGRARRERDRQLELERISRAPVRKIEVPPPPEEEPPPPIKGCVFAKSCKLPDGLINYNNPGGYVPLDLLKDYGAYAVLGSSGAAVGQQQAPARRCIGWEALPALRR